MKSVIVYTSETCTHCDSVKNYMKTNGIEFEEKNVKQPQFRKELMGMGYMSVPVVKIAEDIVVGFDAGKMDALLGL